MPMNPEIKAEWVAALRSGQYVQGTRQLRVVGADGFTTFCCLGVLCDLAAKRGLGAWGGLDFDAAPAIEQPWVDENSASPNSNNLVLPGAVAKWAGFSIEPDEVEFDPVVQIAGRSSRVSIHNDGGDSAEVPARTFAEIADAIEAQL
jgi:hypothetical protein